MQDCIVLYYKLVIRYCKGNRVGKILNASIIGILCLCARTHACVCMCMCVCVYVCVFVCVCVYLSVA